MRVGFTGHQERSGIRWPWVADAIRGELQRVGGTSALSSLSAGSDQVFAEAALALRIPLVAVVPLENYERFFEGSALETYRRLVQHAQIVQLTSSGSPQQAFLEAGQYIVDACDLLLTVWDGEQAAGLGGTGDVVAYARERHRSIVHINPCNEVVCRSG